MHLESDGDGKCVLQRWAISLLALYRMQRKEGNKKIGPLGPPFKLNTATYAFEIGHKFRLEEKLLNSLSCTHKFSGQLELAAYFVPPHPSLPLKLGSKFCEKIAQ